MLSASPLVIQGCYFRDLMAQPEALQRTLEWLQVPARWREVQVLTNSRAWKRVVLTGMGSSFHALHPLNLGLIGAGFTPVMMETSELIHHGMPLCDADTLVVAVSQSGGSAEILRFLDLNQQATVLAVTNTAEGRLAKEADCALLTQAGVEFSVSCKTYVSALLALQWLSALLTGMPEAELSRRLAPLAEQVAAYLRHWPSHTEALAVWMSGVRHLFLVGRGASLAAAGTGALIIKESARMHAEGLSSAAFRHGPLEMMRADMCVAIFTGAATPGATTVGVPTPRALNLRLAQELRERGTRCGVIGVSAAHASIHLTPLNLPEIDALTAPVVEILPAQMMSLALAGLAGCEAGVFESARKITDTE